MFHAELEIPVKSVDQALISRQCFKGNGINEISSILCHKYMYFRSCFYQGTCQIGDLICGNAAGHSKEYCFSF